MLKMKWWKEMHGGGKCMVLSVIASFVHESCPDSSLLI